MTPKSLLRHPEAKSKFSDFDEGTRLLRLIPDSTAVEGEGVKRVVFCSGKVYYELAKQRELAGLQDTVAIARVEQVRCVCVCVCVCVLHVCVYTIHTVKCIIIDTHCPESGTNTC